MRRPLRVPLPPGADGTPRAVGCAYGPARFTGRVADGEVVGVVRWRPTTWGAATVALGVLVAVGAVLLVGSGHPVWAVVLLLGGSAVVAVNGLGVLVTNGNRRGAELQLLVRRLVEELESGRR